ncbi:MAG: ATP-binding cassette domain-containing protein [Verrucomicrobia bacterium]|nr:ATP-binding cassette domain-containing protein [Verrucomicrobiota bacterium]MDA1086500.1 ATP-binding cassette domain-containing protein [Verrucomicrobiota bacterium]
MALIGCQELQISFGGAHLLRDANFLIERRERIGLLGRNGEGKSTLLKLLARELEPDEGKLVYAAGVKVARLAQDVPAGIDGPVGDRIRDGAGQAAEEHAMQRLCSQFDLDPEQDFSTLSGGQKRKVHLARALVNAPDLLLLDEPTNHLDLDGIQMLESFLERYNGSLVFVTHDRAFLQRLATRIVELDRGVLTSWDCDYPTFLRRKDAFLIAEEARWAQFDKKLAKEEVWIRQGIKARRTRNEGRVRALEKLRVDRAARRERIGTAKIYIQAAGRSGQKVIAANGISFRYPAPITPERDAPAGQLIVDDFSTEIMRGDKIGIIGPNGCGKTTLLHLLLGRLQPQQGTVKHGTRLDVAYFDQHRQQLDPARTVLDNVSDGRETLLIDGKPRHVISYLEDFLFEPQRMRQPVSVLSGGERNRLLLARLFTEASNVLVLDEPTNDLDTETLELLEARLLDYAGTVLLVSHDRFFLDNISTSSIVFEGPGVLREVVGGYTDWQNTRAAQAGTATGSNAARRQKPGATAAGAKKLSNKERAEWKRLPAEIETLENDLAALGKSMADPAFFRSEPAALKRSAERAARLAREIERAFERWAALDART